MSTRILPKTGEPVQLDPRRAFTKVQRLQILLASDGRCARCGVKLGKDWQADHVLAWNLGGRTEVGNGEALGPCCYVSKNGKDTTQAAKTKRQAKLCEPRQPSKRPIRGRSSFQKGHRPFPKRPKPASRSRLLDPQTERESLREEP